MPCQAVDAAARRVSTEAGYGPGYTYFSHRVGRSIGMDGHEWPYLVDGNTLPPEPGMTFRDEPGIYIRGEFGMRLEDDMVITPTAPGCSPRRARRWNSRSAPTDARGAERSLY